MFENLTKCFSEVMNLSLKREEAYDHEIENGQKCISLYDIKYENNQQSDKIEKQLNNLLLSLDYKTIKTMHVIMYLGRDQDYDSTQSTQMIYQKERKYFDNLGWKTKEIEVSQMIEKMQLGKYLQNGFKILGINV